MHKGVGEVEDAQHTALIQVGRLTVAAGYEEVRSLRPETVRASDFGELTSLT